MTTHEPVKTCSLEGLPCPPLAPALLPLPTWNPFAPVRSCYHPLGEVMFSQVSVILSKFYLGGVSPAGFSPIKEIRENFEDFSQSGKTGGFSTKLGGKIEIRELFFQTIFKPFKPINLRKMFLRLLNLRSCQEIAIFA